MRRHVGVSRRGGADVGSAIRVPRPLGPGSIDFKLGRLVDGVRRIRRTHR